MPQGQSLTVVKSEPLAEPALSVVKSEPLTVTSSALTPPPAPPSGWQTAKDKLEAGWNQAGFPGAQFVKPVAEGVVDVVKHPIRNLPLIGGAIGGAAGGIPGAALGAAGGEAGRQLYETGKSQITGRPPEQPQGPVAKMAPPTTTSGGAALSIAREAVTSGVLPEVGGKVVSKLLTGPLRPPPGSADAAVAATSTGLGLGLTAGEISSSVPGRALHGVEKVGNIGAGGHAIAEKARAAGEAKASSVLGGQLDAIAAPVTKAEAGAAVNTSAKDARDILLEQHKGVQYARELAHGKQEAARRAVHNANRDAALAEHRTTQAELGAAHDTAEATKATEFRATNQATFDAALKAKREAGQQMETVAKGVRTPVNNAAVKAEAQRLIETELRPPAEAYPLKAPDSTEAAAADFLKSDQKTGGGKIAFQDLPPEVQAHLRERSATTGEAEPAEIDPLEYANATVRKHLTRVANAGDTADFSAAWQYYSDLLADSKFLKAMRSPGEGQLSALAKAQRASLEEAASASGVDWAATSAQHAAAADTAREAAKGLSKRYTPKPYKVAGFKYPAYTPEKFKADPFSPGGYLKRMLTDEPSQLLDAFSKDGRVVPERIRAARETLLGTVADKPVTPPPVSQSTRNAAAKAEQVRSGVQPGKAGAAASYTPPVTQATWRQTPGEVLAGVEPPPSIAPPQGAPPPRPAGPWDANAPPPPPQAQAGAPPAAPGPSAVHARGQAAWDQLRTTLVRDQLLTGPMHGLQSRLQKFGPEWLKELFPGEPQVAENLNRIGEAFARRSPQSPTWQYRTLEVLAAPVTAGGAMLYGVPPGKAIGSAAGVLAGLEGAPAIIAWAAHSPTMTKLLLEGVTSTDSTQAVSTLTRLMEAYRQDQRGGPLTPPPAPRR